MSYTNNTLGRFRHFGRSATFNPFTNSQDLKSLADQWFYIPNQSAFANSNTLLISSGLITNEIALLNNFSAEIVDVNGTVIKSLIAKIGDVGMSRQPNEDEIFWFDVEGAQGDYWINKTHAGKILRINGKFEATAIVADEVNQLTGCIMGFGGSLASIPNRALVCQGQAVSRFYYTNLFAVIGTRFGSGDGAKTFNLPDLRDGVLKGCNGERASGVVNSVLNDPDNVSRFAGRTGGASGKNVGSYQRFATQQDNRQQEFSGILGGLDDEGFYASGVFSHRSQVHGPNGAGTGHHVNFYLKVNLTYGTGQSTRDNNVYVHHIIFI